VAPYIAMPLVGGASCGASDWTKPRLSMRLVRETKRVEKPGFEHSFTNINKSKGITQSQIVHSRTA